MTADLQLVAWQVSYEVRAFFRNRRAAFFGLALPLLLLGLLGALGHNQVMTNRGNIPLDSYLVPGLMSYGLLLTAFTGVLMSTALLRDAGVLKRVQGTPMPWWAYMTGRLGAVVTAAAVMVAAMMALGYGAFNIPVRLATLPGLLVTLGLGVACLTTLALGLLRFVPNAEAARPIAVGILVPVSIISGQFGPLDGAPKWLDKLANLLPVKPMTDALQYAFDPRTHGPGFAGHDLLVLGIWTFVGIRLMMGFWRTETRRG
jgi:ABC-2 type transport system permease protein